MAKDVSEVHPLRPSNSQAGDAAGRAAIQREQSKHQQYTAPCKAVGWTFAQCTAKTTSGPSGQRLVRTLIRRQSMRFGLLIGETASAVWERLSAVVAKGTACKLVRAFGLEWERPSKAPCVRLFILG